MCAKKVLSTEPTHKTELCEPTLTHNHLKYDSGIYNCKK